MTGAATVATIEPVTPSTGQGVVVPEDPTWLLWGRLTDELTALGFGPESSTRSVDDGDRLPETHVAVELDGWQVQITSTDHRLTADQLREILATARFTGVTCPVIAPAAGTGGS